MKKASKPMFQKWTDEEKSLLVHFVKTAVKQGKSVKDGCNFAAKKLGRSGAACQAMYHTNLKSVLPPIALQKVATPKKSIQKVVRVMYHNGTSKEAEILVNTDSYIVAKCGDAVITIDKV